MKRFFGILTALLLMFTQNHVYADSGQQPEAAACSALIEAQTGMLLRGEQSDRQTAAGSQTKLMTVLLTAQAVECGKLAEDAEIRVPSCAEGVSGASVWLMSGEKMTVTELLKAVIIGNANDASVALACAVSGTEQGFVSQMNAEAFSLGLHSTRFADCTGMSAENVTTAYELALICRELLQYAWLTPLFTTWRDFLRDGATELVNENRLVRTEENLLGMKAGHGSESGYTLTLAGERDGMRCISVVLGCADQEECFRTGKKLLGTGFSEYTVTTPDFSAEFLRPVTVRRGMSNAVLAESVQLRAAAVPAGETVSCTVILPQYVAAPVRAGDVLGEIAFYCGDTLLYEAELTAAADVPYRGLRETFCLLLGNLFK
ncbi:MAG: D-alanyl-D-alanine carboxypeptidase [Oscillospiraceae bacterium]|nr:D-alanyl-D-alanine carboxypeptidase [Oscillospiraceae bacterium]